MKAINLFWEFYEKGLSKEVDFFEFSVDLEDYIGENYEEIAKENETLAYYAADIIPDICEPMEPGMDPTEFYQQLEKLKAELLAMQ